MRKVAFISILGVLFPLMTVAQTGKDASALYNEFKQNVEKEYADFHSQANHEYIDFMQRTWKYYQALPEIPKPKDEQPRPPVIYLAKEEDKEIKEDNLQPYAELIPVIEEKTQPKPIAPIKEQPYEECFSFFFFQTNCKVRLGEGQRFTLKSCHAKDLADAWQRLSGKEYNNVLRDCLELRIRLHLCDWAYLLMLQELACSYLGRDTDEATLFAGYLFCQSGYQMRLAEANGRIRLMFGTKHVIYEREYWVIDGVNYYPLGGEEKSLNICQATFPQAQPLSLVVLEEPMLASVATQERTLQSKAYPELKATVTSNQNLLDFFSTYPSSMLGNDFGTRWAFYANTSLSRQSQKKLYPVLKNAIAGKSQRDAANMLINFVQTAFVYEYDDKVWGGDRAFFADETLYYPYCDCEDRAILFTRLVRDLLGLKAALVYYPGHLATAIAIGNDVKGDYLMIDNTKYIVCDPTYIGAPVGVTMPGMDNEKAKVILL